jgi:hypothetical protein
VWAAVSNVGWFADSAISNGIGRYLSFDPRSSAASQRQNRKAEPANSQRSPEHEHVQHRLVVIIVKDNVFVYSTGLARPFFALATLSPMFFIQ